MIEFKVETKNISIEELFIERYNSVLVMNKNTLLKFIYTILETLEDNANSTIFIGSKRLNSKNTILVNLIDIDSIYNQLQYKKGTILYEYIMLMIQPNFEKFEYEITDFLNQTFSNISLNTGIDFEFEFTTDITKILSGFSKIIIHSGIEEYFSLLNKMLNIILKRQPAKTIIILQDSGYLNLDFNEFENVYVFDVNSKQNPNILICNSVMNYDIQLMLSHIRIMWPQDITTANLKVIIEEYFNFIIKNNIQFTDNYEYCIVNEVLKRAYNINYTLEYKSDKNLPSEIENFLKSL